MNRPTRFRHSAQQRGIALVITLVLLLVMTMIAVVAMRTTTVDLKMTTNIVLSKRAFQNSEGARTAIGQVLSSHMFHRGWPPTLGGVGQSDYDIPPDVFPVVWTAHFDTNENGQLDGVGPPTFTRNPDIRFKHDLNNDNVVDTNDMFANIWVTYLRTRICAGCSAQVAAGTTGAGTSNGNALTFLDVRSRGAAPGNAQLVTGAEFRALVRN
jgi:hypothetical protein